MCIDLSISGYCYYTKYKASMCVSDHRSWIKWMTLIDIFIKKMPQRIALILLLSWLALYGLFFGAMMTTRVALDITFVERLPEPLQYETHRHCQNGTSYFYVPQQKSLKQFCSVTLTKEKLIPKDIIIYSMYGMIEIFIFLVAFSLAFLISFKYELYRILIGALFGILGPLFLSTIFLIIILYVRNPTNDFLLFMSTKIAYTVMIIVFMTFYLYRTRKEIFSQKLIKNIILRIDQKMTTMTFYVLISLYMILCMIFGIWQIVLKIKGKNTYAYHLDMVIAIFDLTSASLCILLMITNLLLPINRKVINIVWYFIALILGLIILANDAVLIFSVMRLRLAPANIVFSSLLIDCIVKGCFQLVTIITYIMIYSVKYYVLSKLWYTNYAKNIDIDLEAPLIDDKVNEGFERDIQKWIIDIKDLKFEERISEGTFGVVFRGKYRGSNVAIKKIRAISNDMEFEHEVKMLINLRHPNIVLFMGACMGAEFRFIITELMSFSVDRILYKNNIRKENVDDQWHISLTFNQKIMILCDVARAVAFMHSREPPVCHRDLKPSNILLDKNITMAKICDFGTSRNVVSNATMTGNIGTFMYMSPEVLFNRPYTEKCDVYSFGIIMHEIFFECRPYCDDEIDTNNPFLLGTKVTQGKRPTIPDMSLSSEKEISFIKLAQRCWNHEPELRPTFFELLETLENMI